MLNVMDKDYVPEIKNIEELKSKLKPLYVINDYMKTPEEFMEFIESVYDIIKGCFEKKDCREFEVNFKFYIKDKTTHKLQFRHFIINLFIWYPLSELYGLDVMDESFINDCNEGSTYKGLLDHLNLYIINTLSDHNLKYATISKRMAESLHLLRRLSLDFSAILGLSMDLESFTSLYENNERMREIMTTQFPEDIQPNELESALDLLQAEEVEIFKSIPNNVVGVILRAGSGINLKQLTEFSINMGLKPDIVGKTIPVPINSNTLIGGLNSPSSLFTDANGAWKSLVLNKKVMGRAGHFGKTVLMLAHTLVLSTTVSDCDTKHPISVIIRSDKMLEKYNNRFYRTMDDITGDYKLLKYKKDKHLIGETILVRSPATCALPGDEICQKCYGYNANLNFDIAKGIAGFASQEWTKVINQNVLSAKHLLTTISEMINFNDNFYKFFTMLAGEISPKLTAEDALEDIDDYAIFIAPADIVRVEEMDDDSLFNTVIETGVFYVRNLKTKEDIQISSNGKELFLSEETIEMVKTGKMINFKDLDDDTVLFVVEIMNNELTKPLYEIMSLLNKERKIDPWDISEVCQKFTDLLIESNIDSSAVLSEMTINRLLRDPHNMYDRPDFSNSEMPDYVVKTITHCIENNKSPLLGISFQYIKRQFLSDDLYEKRFAPSYIDPLFKKNISTKTMKEFFNNLKK